MADILSKIQVAAYDMDGTLYRITDESHGAIHALQARILCDETRGALSFEDAAVLASQSWKAHHNSWKLPCERLGLGTDAMNRLDAIYHARLGVEHATPLPRLSESFAAVADAGFGRILHSHSYLEFVGRMTRHLGVSDYIPDDRRVTIEQVDFQPKHSSIAMFAEVVRRSGVASDQILVIEDNQDNTKTAKSIGMHTALIHWGQPLAVLPAHIDMQFETPVEANRALVNARRGLHAT